MLHLLRHRDCFGNRGRIRQLVVPRLELVPIRTNRLRQNLVDHRRQRAVRARQRAKILGLINQPPQVLRVGMLTGTTGGEGAERVEERLGVVERRLDFLQEVEAALDDAKPFLDSLRALASRRPREHPDTKNLWRLIYQAENLRALPRAHGTLSAMIDEILSQTVGPYRNKLEARHDELSDPATIPEAVAVAATLERAIAEDEQVM